MAVLRDIDHPLRGLRFGVLLEGAGEAEAEDGEGDRESGSECRAANAAVVPPTLSDTETSAGMTADIRSER
jgi:hypothetical protein